MKPKLSWSRYSRSGVGLSIVVTIAAAHSVLLGLVLIAFPHWLLDIWRWPISCDPFFLRQVGVFHILLGAFYFWEWYTTGGLVVLLVAKSSAVIFLAVHFIIGDSQPAILAAGVFDAAVAVSAVWMRGSAGPTTAK